MLSLCLVFVVFSLLFQNASGSSFYDNPEQDPLTPPDTAEELHRKWDHEVEFISISS